MRRYADGIVRRWDAEVSTAASVPSMSSPSKPLTYRSRSYDPHHQAFSVPFAIAMTLSAASSKLSNARSGNPLSRIYSHVARLAADSTSVSQLKPSTPETEICFQNQLTICCPSPSFVPLNLTTTGTFNSKSLKARIIPSAIISDLVRPPKMLTKITRTRGSDVMILKEALMVRAVALPPVSRKLAG